jgi:hypothetical protein
MLILSTHLQLFLPNCVFLSGFRMSILHMFLTSPCVLNVQYIPLDISSNIWWIVQIIIPSLSIFLLRSVTSSIVYKYPTQYFVRRHSVYILPFRLPTKFMPITLYRPCVISFTILWFSLYVWLFRGQWELYIHLHAKLRPNNYPFSHGVNYAFQFVRIKNAFLEKRK